MRWFWKIGEIVVVLGLLVFLTIPDFFEAVYAGAMYNAHPVFFMTWVVLATVFAIAVAIHALKEWRQKRKTKQTEAVPCRGTL